MASSFPSIVVVNRIMSFLLLALGATITAFESISRMKFHDFDGTLSYWPQPTDFVRDRLALAPDGVKYGSYAAVLTAGIVSVVVGFISFLTSFGWNKSKRFPYIPTVYP